MSPLSEYLRQLVLHHQATMAHVQIATDNAPSRRRERHLDVGMHLQESTANMSTRCRWCSGNSEAPQESNARKT